MAQEQSLFSEVTSLQQQTSSDKLVFPAVLYPNPNVSSPIQLTDAIKANKKWLDSLLDEYSAVLFRGFPVSTAYDFNEVVESAGYDDFLYGAGGAGSRTKVCGRVYTANESPPFIYLIMAQEQSLFSEVTSLQQHKSSDKLVFPAVLYPNPNVSSPIQLTDAIKANKKWLDSLLDQYSAVLFRGFPVSTAYDFNEVVESAGYDDFLYGAGGAGSRTKVCGRVYTANESPPDQKIGFHHELSHLNEFPSKLFFFCEVEPGNGGETCIVLSHVIYDKMKQKHPKFVQRLEEKGLIYNRVMGKEFDPSSPTGRGWKAIYMTDDKKVAEERAAKLGTKLEWMGDNVKVVLGPKPCFRYDEARQRKTWFNGLAISYGGAKDKLNDDPTKQVAFGDGEALPPEEVHGFLNMLDEECVALKWQKGDVLLLDNLAALHSRRPLLTPPRRILASFCK